MEYSLTTFGGKLRSLRKKHVLTQLDVSKATGVNVETLRRVEQGKVVPKIETLEYLSPVLKEDVLLLFFKHRYQDYSLLQEKKARLERNLDNGDFSKLELEVKKINKMIPKIKNKYYKRLIEQQLLFAKGIIKYKKENDSSKALNMLIRAIKLTTPKFELDNFQSYVYSSTEVRILMNIGMIVNSLGRNKEYLNILEFSIKTIKNTDELYPKICHNLAGAYIRKGDYINGLKYSNFGVDWCKNNRIYAGLNLLYYSKGVCQFYLKDKNYKSSVELAICLCEAYGQDKLKKLMLSNYADLKKQGCIRQ
ncbi:helix-turn-helix transcriptional regulator [Proteinivorax hydrogeniformans]|uniref:Helix-turn-helix transcriptional regulator n=1 Tax=Proteinivorax hydrogeniformans TaxID=1826727 RepID=A0AAU8HQU1_9FIRM